MSTSQILRLTRKLELTAEQEQDFLDAMQAGDRSRSALVITPKAPEGYLPPLPAEVDRELAALVRKMLAKSATGRPRSAAAVAQRMDELAARAGQPAPGTNARAVDVFAAAVLPVDPNAKDDVPAPIAVRAAAASAAVITARPTVVESEIPVAA